VEKPKALVRADGDYVKFYRKKTAKPRSILGGWLYRMGFAQGKPTLSKNNGRCPRGLGDIPAAWLYRNKSIEDPSHRQMQIGGSSKQFIQLYFITGGVTSGNRTREA
jgi:hypothetical protein